jgi:hypothetical protein
VPDLPGEVEGLQPAAPAREMVREPPPPGEPGAAASPRPLLFDDLAASRPPPRRADGDRPPVPPAPAPAPRVVDPVGPGPVEVDEEAGIARIDSRRGAPASPAARQPTFRADVARPAGTAAGPRRPRRRSEPLRGR